MFCSITFSLYSAGVSSTFNVPKNYYFPIPDAETKRLPRLGQNQGWELSTSTGGDENDSNEETPAE